MINKDFYPTPRNLVNKLLFDINLKEMSTILEPSAGKGDILDVISDKFSIYKSNDKKDHVKMIDCVEIETELQAILKDKGYRVTGSDFLKYNTYKHYDLIVANVPFSEGDKHILKMIQLAENNNGSKIRCLCNAETLKNPYSNDRKLILDKIEKYNGKVEYIENAFIDAERKTGVEVALIRLDVPKQLGNSIILDSMKKAELYQDEYIEGYEVGEQQSFIDGICKQYKQEIEATVKLINEYNRVSKLSLREFKENSSPILELRVHGDKSHIYNSDIINNVIREIRGKYWEAMLLSDEMQKLMTSNIRTQWWGKMEELKDYDFTPFNIRQIQFDIKMSLSQGIENTIITLFDEFTKYAMQDGSKNIHMYNGWKTNDAYKLGQKVIMPYMSAYGWSGYLSYHNVHDRLRDIEKVFSYIDGGILQMDHVDLDSTVEMNFKYGNVKEIECKYFRLTFYKKGTCHITFNDKYKKVVDRFNYIAGSLKGWLPNSYGKENYNDMSAQDKAVVNSYCGKDTYIKEVEPNKAMYRFSIDGLLLGNAS